MTLSRVRHAVDSTVDILKSHAAVVRWTAPFIAFVTIAGVLAAPRLSAQDLIAVDVNAPIATVERGRVGINLNFLLDDDGNRRTALKRLADALREAGVKYLRYPGGEKSDAYLWSVPPYNASVPTLARWASGDWPQNQEWPSYDRSLVQSDGRTFLTDPLSFDEFMDVCHQIGCIPTIVVCYDSMYKPAQPGGVAPTRSQLLDTAREWVRYANVTRGYDVRYWEIGNESWIQTYNGGTTASQYAADLIDFSRTMKEVDPSIQIGANGASDDWWNTVLASASGAIDFLVVHDYPAYSWPSYTYYRDHDVSLVDVVRTAEWAIAAYAPPPDRSRLKIAVTETNSAAWSDWPDLNDMGHAVVLFDIFGQLLQDPQVAFAELWTTRWSGNDTTPVPRIWDAFDKDNNLQATGTVVGLWSQNALDTIVSATSARLVKAYATRSTTQSAVTVFLVNKDTTPRDTVTTINGLAPALRVERQVFAGGRPDDLYPTLSSSSAVSSSGNSIALRLDPVSITILRIAPDARATAVPGTIEAEDFDEGRFFDSTPGNAGGSYRSTDVDIQPTSDVGGGYNVGWIDAGEWLEYTIQVAATGTYELDARVASPSSGTTFAYAVDDVFVGVIDVPTTGAWQSWTTVPAIVALTEGIHRLRVSTSTGAFNLNKIVVRAAAAVVAHPAPGVVEAEDFDEGSYSDSTPGNAGGQYRSTDVDIEATSDAGGGYNVGWFDAGEWLDYTIQVTTASAFEIDARVASPRDGVTIRLLLDGAPIGDVMAVPNTGGWQSWATVTTVTTTVLPGVHRIRMTTDTGWLNVNWLRLRRN